MEGLPVLCLSQEGVSFGALAAMHREESLVKPIPRNAWGCLGGVCPVNLTGFPPLPSLWCLHGKAVSKHRAKSIDRGPGPKPAATTQSMERLTGLRDNPTTRSHFWNL